MSALSDALPFDKMLFSGSTQESASFVPRDRLFSVRMEESPQIIALNHILIASVPPKDVSLVKMESSGANIASSGANIASSEPNIASSGCGVCIRSRRHL